MNKWLYFLGGIATGVIGLGTCAYLSGSSTSSATEMDNDNASSTNIGASEADEVSSADTSSVAPDQKSQAKA